MLAETTPCVDRTLMIEISSVWRQAPALVEDLLRCDVNLLGQSRLIRIQGTDDSLRPHHLNALLDPLLEEAEIADEGTIPASGVDVFCHLGVTDAEGEMAALALAHAGLTGLHCRAGTRYRFAPPVPVGMRRAVEHLLGNPLIHSFYWHDGADEFPIGASTTEPPGGPVVATVELRGHGDEDLLAISRELGLALDGEEMRAIAAHFAGLERPPTDVELQSLALTWSEHCSHKTFKATIELEGEGRREVIPGLLQTCFVAPTRQLHRSWVRSAFVDNAGVIAFDGQNDLAFKVETHNHPSALEPFGGAHTGVGGVIRDILAVSAEPIANTDVLCFGPPDLPDGAVPAGSFHPHHTCREVVRGVADYGNNMGIPTVGGAVLFHPGYVANPLVYCGTVGLAPAGSHPREPLAGDAIVLLGGRTGRDGLHGATMSSASLDREQVAGSTVQIGAPVTEKVLRDVLPRLRDERLYHAITDCGAGGLCSAIGEMGAELGVEVELDRVPLKYAGLRPWEIWLSEAQERMILAVAPETLPRLMELCYGYDVEVTELGRFRRDGEMVLRFQGQVVAELDMGFLHKGRPPRVLHARYRPNRGGRSGRSGRFLPLLRSASARPSGPIAPPAEAGLCHYEDDYEDERESPRRRTASWSEVLPRLLAHPNIASKEEVIRRYDHEVGAATVVKPLVGRAGPSDAAVIRPLHHSWRGVVLGHGINPLYGDLDPHAMAMLAVDEALRNLVAVGGSIARAALLDNFCWGNVDDPEALGTLVRAAQGCRDAALAYRVPFVSGKDSLRNTSITAAGEHEIPGTLLISAMGVIPDVRRCVTMDLKAPRSSVYLLGRTAAELGGSHQYWLQGVDSGQVPRVRPRETRRLMRLLTRAIRCGLVRSCHDLSEGGLAVAAAEMAIAGGLGLDLDLEGVDLMLGEESGLEMELETAAVEEILLFAESPGRFLVEVGPDVEGVFAVRFAGIPCRRIGRVCADDRLLIHRAGAELVDLPLTDLDTAWRRAGPGDGGQEGRDA